MRKIFTFAVAVLMTMSMWAVDIYKTDVATTLESPATATINKGAFETLTIDWKGDYTTAFHTSGSAGAIKLTFEPAISLADYSGVKLKVFWGSPSSRPLKVAVNDGELTQIDNIGSSADRKQIREAVGDITETSLTSLNITSSGGGDVYIFRIEISGDAKCETPTTPLTFTASKTSEIYVGDEITFSSAGGNGGEKPITLDGSPFTAEKWTAEAGEHKFVMTQDTKDGKCGATIEIKLNVATKDKVESAKITGSNATSIGKEITLTCEAANATSWQWYKDGAKITDAKSAEYKFTPTAAGNVVFAVEAWNKFNEEGKPAKSADFTVEVSDFECGVLATIEATAYNEAKISGSFAGTASASMSKKDAEKAEYEGHTGYKLNTKNTFLGAEFTDGTLKAKDKVIVYVTNVSAKLEVFSDKGNTLIASTDQVVLGENILVLGAEAEGAKGLYIYRTEAAGADMNPFVSYLVLKRPCHDESNDASIKSLKIGDKEVEAKDNLYALELASDFAEMQLEITFELNESHATADKTSPFSVLAPENSTDTIKSEINVTAEDGTKAHYAIQITRAEAPKSTDASITELKINEVAVAEKEGIFAYEVAFDAELDSVAVAFVLAEKATADKTSPFKVLVPEAGAAAVEEAINVTAEDGVTKKEYKVSVTKAKKSEEAIDNIGDGAKAVKFFENGQLLIRKNGVLYNAQGAIVK